MTQSVGLAVPLLLVVVAAAACGAAALRNDTSEGAPPASVSAPGTASTPAKYETAELVLDGKLAKGWVDWGWGPHDTPDAGSIRVTFEGYGGLLLHHEELPARFGAVLFRYRAPPDYADFLEISLKHHSANETVLPKVRVESPYITAVGGGWVEAAIPFSALNPKGVPFSQILIQAFRPVGATPVNIDKVSLAKPLPGAPPPERSPARPVKLQVRCDEPSVKINPLIYGIANGEFGTGAPARRYGGNPLTRMNWDIAAWNTASDWYFENQKAGNTVTGWLAESREHGLRSAIVVPTIGWVAKDATSVGFPVSKYGPQRAADPYRPDVGDGYDKRGRPIRGSPGDTSVPAPPELIKKWVAAIREADKKTGVRSIDMYILDNEPSLWNTTHRDVHPDPVTYDELLDRTIRYGAAIRAADPDAVIAGPAEWGWTGYFFSGKDTENNRAGVDRKAHGDVPLLPWYLKKLAEHERRTRTRILDVVDVHFYPQAPGIWGQGGRTDPDGAALRLRTTRALWDPSYRDESWISDNVELIPRLRKWIQENYPGRGISIGEWNFGAEDHMSGGLAVAEVLGRFGQLGVTSAFYWLGPAQGTPAFNAFRAFRNFDGKGSAFLGWSVPTKSVDPMSLFASKNDDQSRLVLVLLNLDPHAALEAEIDVATCGVPGARRALVYESHTPGFLPEKSGTGGPLKERLEPYSMRVVDVAIAKPTLR